MYYLNKKNIQNKKLNKKIKLKNKYGIKIHF